MKADAILMVGAGGHVGVLIELLQALGAYRIAGLVERADAVVTEAHGLPVIGHDGDLTRLRAAGTALAAVGIGSAPDNGPRRRAFEALREAGFDMPVLVHPRSWVADSATLGAGAQVMAGALIQGRAVLGDNVLVNTGSIVEHDCRVGAHSHIATGVRMGGDVKIGDAAFVGVGSSIRQGIRIGSGAVIGAGSVVVDDVAAGARVAGTPARPLKGGR